MVQRLGRKRKREEEVLAPAEAASAVRDELVYATETRVFKCVVGATATRKFPGPPGGEVAGEAGGELYGMLSFICAMFQPEPVFPGAKADRLPEKFAQRVLEKLQDPKNPWANKLKREMFTASVLDGPSSKRRRNVDVVRLSGLRELYTQLQSQLAVEFKLRLPAGIRAVFMPLLIRLAAGDRSAVRAC